MLGRITSAVKEVAAKAARGEPLSDAEAGAAHFVGIHGLGVAISAEGLGLPPDADGAAYLFALEPLENTLEEAMLRVRGGLLSNEDTLVALLHAIRGLVFLHMQGIVVRGGGGPAHHTTPARSATLAVHACSTRTSSLPTS